MSYKIKFQHVPILQDRIKWILAPTKSILEVVGLWPEEQKIVNKIVTLICFLSLSFVMAGQCYYLYQNKSNLADAAYVFTIFLPVIEAISRQIFVNIYKKRLITLLNTIYSDFWPSNIVGEDTERELGRNAWFIVLYCFIYLSSAFVCVVLLFMVPLLSANRYLTLLSTYPFPYWKSPLYEILHVWHCITGEAMVFIICGMDMFFTVLMWNCIAQFVILRRYLQKNFETNIRQGKNGIIHLLKCIKHHNLLIRTSKEMENMFSDFILLLFLTSTGTFCVACFVVTVMPKEIAMCGTYILGHLCQLFIYCYMGTQIAYESTALSDAVFHCGWDFSNEFNELKRPLLMLMIRSQRPQQLTAGGFADVDLSSFLKVLKLSFSVYTLLNSLID